ncbi:MAG: hypothetical protein VX733_07280 [Candidatus Latescibacterota bacterium]|nr:hypothetical protein [Candidatus Latescibacterota bacterium]
MSDTSAPPTLRRFWVPIAVFTGLSVFGLRQPLSVTEAVFLTRSELPLGDLLLFPYSPLYLVLLRLWSAISSDPLWLRLLGVFLGIGGFALVPRVLRGLGGVHATAGAMWILALMPFFVDQARSITPSALAFLCTTAAIICFLEFLRAGELPWIAGWVVATLMSLFVHGGLYYLALVLCLAMAFYRERYHGRQRVWWLAQIPPLTLFAVLSGAQFEHFIAHRIADVNSIAAAAAQWGMLATQQSARPWVLSSGLLLAFLVASGLYACRALHRDLRHGLVVLGAGAPCVIWLAWLPHDFYAVAALPFLATLASMGIRLYPLWGRQLLWSALAVTYAFSYWFA